jgi:energy-coupling factor transport system permease protein
VGIFVRPGERPMRKDVFAGYHPAINFFFLCGAIFMGLMIQHPLWTAISLIAATAYALLLGGQKALRFILSFVLPIVLLTALLNPLFVHQGVTILFYFRENPVTLEAGIYGVTRGLMFGAGLLWFYCYQYLMTGDKFMYLFGKVIPSGSLIFSMVLSFIPRFYNRMKVISDAQKCVGRDVTDGSAKEKIRHGIKVLSIMTTWSLESAIDTSDSMKSRGYGLKHRSSFVPYHFERRDMMMGVGLLGLLALTMLATALGFNFFQSYPTLAMSMASPLNGLFALAYGLFCFTPFILNVAEALKWKHIQSEI